LNKNSREEKFKKQKNSSENKEKRQAEAETSAIELVKEAGRPAYFW
jgi:hypothetical protein